MSWNRSDPRSASASIAITSPSRWSRRWPTTFPVVRQLVGDAFFRAMAGAFVRQSPPVSPVLAWLRRCLCRLRVAAFPPAAGVPYLADVARLEYDRVVAFHATDAEPVPVAEIAACLNDAAALPALRLQLHPSLRVIDSPFAIASLWGRASGPWRSRQHRPGATRMRTRAAPWPVGRDHFRAGGCPLRYPRCRVVQRLAPPCSRPARMALPSTHPVLGLLIGREQLVGLG